MRKWFTRHHWQKSQHPREAWVVLLDGEGREVSERIPVVLHASDPHEFTIEQPLTFRPGETRAVTHVRVIDVDGVRTDKPLAPQR